MNAYDKRLQSEKKARELNEQQWVRINKYINDAVNKGLLQALVTETITDVNIQTLQDSGFVITKRGGRIGEMDCYIKWDRSKEPNTGD